MTVSEFEWIERIRDRLAGIGGDAIGDDAAVLAPFDGDLPVWTIDAHVEDVHFRFDQLDAETIGFRAFTAAVSDLAAMAARPVAALVTLAGPAEGVARQLDPIYDGLAAAAQIARCPIVGGDLTRAEKLSIVVTAIGRSRAPNVVRRTGARVGDELWVTGALGGPAAALAMLDSGVTLAADHAAFRRFARPRARIDEMRWLVDRASLNAAVDISDGLSSDAAHISDASGVHLTLVAETIPIDAGARDLAAAHGADPFVWALHGGEEFEVLVTAAPGAIGAVAESFHDRFDTLLTRVGEVAAGTGVGLSRSGREVALDPDGWDHFRGVASADPAR